MVYLELKFDEEIIKKYLIGFSLEKVKEILIKSKLKLKSKHILIGDFQINISSPLSSSL